MAPETKANIVETKNAQATNSVKSGEWKFKTTFKRYGHHDELKVKGCIKVKGLR